MEYSNGLFVCYAPADDPEIAIAVVVEKGAWGSQTSIIAQKLLLAYFGLPDPENTQVVTSDAAIGDVPLATNTPTPGGDTQAPISPTVTPAG